MENHADSQDKEQFSGQPEIEAETPELNDEDLEQVAGGNRPLMTGIDKSPPQSLKKLEFTPQPLP